MRLSLVSIGEPDRRTGGDRYDRIMADAASDHGAAIRFTSIEGTTWPAWFARAAPTLRAASDGSDAILLDSLAAAPAAPWLWRARRPVIAVVHQRPGGVGHGRVRSRIQTALDRAAYRRATGAIVAADGLVDDLGRNGVRADRVRVVSPGCDVPVAPGPPLDLRNGRGASILCVANWSEGKGIVELLDAFAGLPRRRRDPVAHRFAGRRPPLRGSRAPAAGVPGAVAPRGRDRDDAHRRGGTLLPERRHLRDVLDDRRVRNGVDRGPPGGASADRMADGQPARARRARSGGADAHSRGSPRARGGAPHDHDRSGRPWAARGRRTATCGDAPDVGAVGRALLRRRPTTPRRSDDDATLMQRRLPGVSVGI
jgi:glycosyltransferase involved in cell wall biosynthesis